MSFMKIGSLLRGLKVNLSLFSIFFILLAWTKFVIEELHVMPLCDYALLAGRFDGRNTLSWRRD